MSYPHILLGLFLLILTGCSSVPSGFVDPVMARYDEVSEELEVLVKEEDPSAAFLLFRSVLEEEPDLASLCHGLSHEIGHAAYEKYGFDDAFRFEDDFCGSGYIHGIVETHLDRIHDIETALPTICPTDSRKCFHGVGHGIMYKTNNDLPYAVSLCNKFNQSFQRIQCAEGVFMEHFETDTRFHKSALLDPEDPFVACRGQNPVDEGVCALYAPRYFLSLHKGAYQDLISWCMNDVPTGPRDACIKGVGSAAMKFFIASPLLAEDVCMHVQEEKRHYCIEGMTSYYVVHYASAQKGEELCPDLLRENQSSCVKIVVESREAYPE